MNERPDPPTNGELWDAERLHEHGRHLAELEGTYRGTDRPDLNRRIKANAEALESAYATIVEALQAERAITPAAEWIVDNFHVISEQLGDVPLRLTPKLWRKLPATAHPQATSWPRIYHIAREYLRYRLWEFDPESLVRMLDGYQELRPLRMAEIWALYPILRIALIDELRRIAVRVEDSLDARAAADDLADWLAGDEDGTRISAASETLAQAENLPSPFTVQLVRRLHSLGKPGLPVLDAFAQGLARHDTSIDDSIQRQHIRRSASNLAARNIITSLRQLASFDWRTLFERTAHVEALLRSRTDYLVCDRRTRDRYRHSIEDLAIASNRHEVAVTRQVLQLVPDAAAGDPASGDLGSWLIGPQRIQLEETLLSPVSVGRHLRRAVLRFAEPLYLGGIGILTLLLVGVALQAGTDVGATSTGALLLLAVLAAFPVSELAIGILNRVWLRAFPPRHLPRLGLETGLDESMKTLVVVPVLLRSGEDAVDACRQLQVHALANPDPHITFALLSDWTDSLTESRPDDEAVLDAARREIARLNAEVAAEGQRFYLLHRKRQWSASEGRFIGWERKRGKLEELNRLLLGHGETSFLPDADGLLRRPKDIRYVLTVDADTRLPLGSVKDLVGVAMHPLNHPVIDTRTGRVTRGYGVLQPRITPLLPAIDERSLYREIVTSGSGIDPYAAAVSDLYQDVFGEGLFTGKGLYDLAAWEKAMQGRVPPEVLLSHDMFEGLFARCGLVSDIEFFEDFPSNSEVAAARQHRWIRGDWQLMPWVMGLRGALPALGRWKMLDNLRRSLLPPLSLALLVTAFIVPPANPFVWLLLMLAPSLIPALITAIERLFDAPAARSQRMHLYRTIANLAGDMARAAVSLAMLAQNSWLSIDAISRAVYRLTISRRKLLEWVTAAQLKASRSGALASFVWPMKSASIVVVATVAIFMVTNHTALALFAPLLLVWWLTPVLAQFLSRPLDVPRASEELPAPVEQELRATARLTWTFFEQFVTAEDNFLPPDNFQEDPTPVVAHRSSPTNIGLYLLSAVAARDFGWLGLHDLAARLQATLASLQKLERFRGHFLNWYDTRTLAPLLPQYVSTVDSGNLAGHLLTLRQACIRFRNGPLLSPRALTGPMDALYQCRQAWLALPDDQGAGSDAGRKVLDVLLQAELRLTAPHATLAQVRETLESVAHALATLQPAQRMPASASRWLQVAQQDIESQLLDLRPLPAARANLPLDVTLEHAGSEAPGEYTALLAALASVEKQCGELFDNMSFAFLLDKRRGLFAIGYRIADATLDESYYDLLASEARLASLIAIAKGDAPRSHWFRLGRRLTGGSARPVLASWSGSMFEYLMPALVMQEPRFSLLDQTNRRVVWQQIRYGSARNLPWGISESAYNVRDRHYTYQYSAFGLPTLGLKRGLASDYVIAPYATALASMYRPVDASLNLRALAQMAGRGDYGFYESLDFTTGRVPNGRQVAVVHSYFAHHQGMSLVALGNVLNDSLMQLRFHADPRIAAVDLLLQERRIRFVEAPAFVEADVPANRKPEESPDVARTVEGHATPTPVMHLLSNRHYTVMVTDSGGGFSSCRGKAVTRWREDATRDCWGTFIYLRDSEERRVWSAGFQPTAAIPDEYHAHLNEESVAIARRDGSLRTTMTVVVAPDDDGELRQITLRNDGTRPRHVELTSYAEIVLAPLRADIAHPGFSNLFVQTEFVADCGALLATRRPRSDRESAVWAAHVIAGHAIQPQAVEYETDRARFIGRGRSNRNPQALEQVEPLSRSVGNVLDPIFSLRAQVTVPARGSRTLTFATFMAGSREQVLQLVQKYRAPALFEHVMQSAWTFARAELHYLASSLGEARLFQALVAHLLVDTQQLRAASVTPAANVLDVSHLWRFAISGDRPILVIRCHSPDEMPFVRQCLRAQEYLRVKQVLIDVVVLNERRHSYMQDLQQAIEYTVREFSAHAAEGGERGGIYALTIDGIGAAERLLLLSLARVVMDPSEGSLQELLSRPPRTRDPESKLPPRSHAPVNLNGPSSVAGREALEFFNGFGGFADEGREYVLALGPGSPATPAPWSNVLANEHFGALVTERGSLCTWSLNSRENQLTPWSNDPVCDPSGECFYLMDDSGALWSPAPQPIQLPQARYDIRHGQGYSRFDLSHAGVESRLTVFVANADPVKVCHLRITNRLATTRRLRIGTYIEWALGAARVGTNRNVQTRVDPTTSAHFARNPALIDFGDRVAFCDLGGRQQHCSDSRHEFIGRNGSTAAPAGLLDPSQWTMAHGPGHDACCVFAVDIELAPGATEDLVLVLGQAANEDQARQLVLAYRQQDPDALLRGVKQHWRQMLGAVQIHTPDRALDLFFNQWLLYQTMACRIWGRAAFYQAGGAYGFRDQLQDVMAVMQAAPAQARAQLLRAAARQYPEGDAQHWWHPPSGRGVRTHISDDRVWLPYVLCHYLDCTNDTALLDEMVPFIEGPPLTIEQEDSHYVPQVSALSATLYEHSARALDVSLATGAHGLPLMGGGDWNDGMNRVGHAGRGESVWLAWLLIATLERFIPVAAGRGDAARAETWRTHRQQLIAACEREAWDGQWYRRAYFDDGTPLGSRHNAECRIDSLSQSWAVISRAADPQRARMAMAAVEQQLQREDDGIVLLFTPPFDRTEHDPGYIKGYLPGLRENGGQYTHAAVWVLMAHAMLGRSEQVAKLLQMLNPVRHSDSREAAQAYRVEPYALAADVYAGAGLAGRGGWTWYTGAAGWLYRVVLEHVLGIRIRAQHITVSPCVPAEWPSFEVRVTLPGVDYTVAMRRADVDAPELLLDGSPVAGDSVPLLRDGSAHRVEALLPRAAGAGGGESQLGMDRLDGQGAREDHAAYEEGYAEQPYE